MSLSSVQSGEYDTAPTNPWNPAQNPDNGGGNDRCTINSGHTVTIEDANDATTDTITVQSGGVFFSKRDIENALSGATVILNGGTFRRNTWSASQTQTVGGDFDVRGTESVFDVQDDGDVSHLVTYNSLNFTNSAARLTFVNTGARDGNRDRFSSALFMADAEIGVDASVDLYPDSGRIELASVTFGGAGARTLTKSGEGTLALVGDSAAGMPAGSHVDVTEGTVLLMAAGAGGNASFTVSNGLVRLEMAEALGQEAVVWLRSDGVLHSAMDVAGTLTDVTVVLDGGRFERETWNPPGGQTIGGDFVLTSTSDFDQRDVGGNTGFLLTYGALRSAGTGPTLNFVNSGIAQNDTTRFVDSVISNGCTIAMAADACTLELQGVGVGASAPVIKTGPKMLKTTGDLYVYLPGGADLVPSTNATLIDWGGAPGSFTAGHTFLSAGGLWTEGSGSNTVTATLGLNKGTIAGTGGRARFEAASSGHVTITGLKDGGRYLYGMKFANMTATIEEIVARLGENPDYESVVAWGSDGVKFRVVSDVEGTGYFCWDNVVNGLGADVVSVSAGFGTVLTVF